MIYIYEISDPLTDVPRYVGQTVNLTARKATHIRAARANTNKGNWKLLSFIKALLNDGYKPIFTIIDCVQDSEADRAEIYWIEQYRNWGFEIFNIHLGGQKNRSGFKRGKDHHNYKKTHPNFLKGIIESRKRIPIDQLSLTGELIKKHDSLWAAKAAVNASSFQSISHCCQGKSKYKTAYGCKWRYAQ